MLRPTLQLIEKLIHSTVGSDKKQGAGTLQDSGLDGSHPVTDHASGISLGWRGSWWTQSHACYRLLNAV